ncbi:MAG: hypothetical protein JHC31_09140 [Sulfurihydrogenibium sp.]|jgi:hypothetical protein|nr:hypothetical protein [Sulfurihydrogenibium sp.]
MARKPYISRFLSSDVKTQRKEEIEEEKSNPSSVEMNSKTKSKKKDPKYKVNKYKGFYITPENEFRLKELQMMFLKNGQRLDESDIINMAIENLHSQIIKSNS